MYCVFADGPISLEDSHTQKFWGKWFGKNEDDKPAKKEEDIDYDLKQELDDDYELSDFDDWHGVERSGEDMTSDDDDDADGGEMMPIFTI